MKGDEQRAEEAKQMAVGNKLSVDARTNSLGYVHSMKLLTGIIAMMLLAFPVISAPAQSGGAKQTFDTAGYYKKKCAECHGSEADKKFNPDLSEQQMLDAILNGQTMEKPPDMPGFADQGINEERAKALLNYMKSLRR